MSTGTPNLSRSVRAYKLALAITSDANRVAAEFPRVAVALQAAARIAVSEGKKAEAQGKEA